MPRYFNRRYNSRIGATTRRLPGFFRRPATRAYSRSFRRRLWRRGSTRRIIGIISRFAEQKYHDKIFNKLSADWSASGSVLNLTDVSQGTTDTTRVGDKIMLNSIELRWLQYIDPALFPTAVDQFYRVIIFKWYDDTTPGAGDILSQVLPPPVGLISPYDHDRKVKRKVLYEKTYSCIWNWPLYQTHRTDQYRKVFINLKSRSSRIKEVHYQAGGTIAVGHIYVLILSNIPLPFGAANAPLEWNMVSRINYTDV